MHNLGPDDYIEGAINLYLDVRARNNWSHLVAARSTDPSATGSSYNTPCLTRAAHEAALLPARRRSSTSSSTCWSFCACCRAATIERGFRADRSLLLARYVVGWRMIRRSPEPGAAARVAARWETARWPRRVTSSCSCCHVAVGSACLVLDRIHVIGSPWLFTLLLFTPSL